MANIHIAYILKVLQVIAKIMQYSKRDFLKKTN